jgi:hypothetical protein
MENKRKTKLIQGFVEKYRAFDIRRNEMVYDALLLSETGQLVTVNADHFNSPFSFFDGCKWMRYTGKEDKEGTEVYDGDIIEFDADEWGDNKSNIHVVSWDNKNSEWSWGGGCASDMYYRRVIGNIYENPELIP